MRAFLTRILLPCLCTLPALPALAQAPEIRQHHEFGIMGGVSNYIGDLQSEHVFPDYNYHPVGGLSYKYFITPRIGLRFGAAFTQLSAADSLSGIDVKRKRNLNFNTDLYEFHGGIEINFLGVDVNRAKVSPYVFGGVALFYFNPYTYEPNGDKLYLRPLSTEGQGLTQYPDRKEYSLVNVSFPIGGGLKFFVGKTLMITTELGFRYCATDYLDDVSKSYVNLDTLGFYRGRQAANYAFRGDEVPGWDGNNPNYKFQRGDSRNYDWYWFGGLGVNIYFDAFGNKGGGYKQTRCPRRIF